MSSIRILWRPAAMHRSRTLLLALAALAFAEAPARADYMSEINSPQAKAAYDLFSSGYYDSNYLTRDQKIMFGAFADRAGTMRIFSKVQSGLPLTRSDKLVVKVITNTQA